MVAGPNQRSLFDVPVPKELRRDRTTLDPLRIHGPDALKPLEIPRLVRVVLRGLKIVYNNAFRQTSSREAHDLFACGTTPGSWQQPIPTSGRLVEARFDFYFSDSPVPHPVIIRPPYQLELAHPADAEIVRCWATLHHFLSHLETTGGFDE